MRRLISFACLLLASLPSNLFAQCGGPRGYVSAGAGVTIDPSGEPRSGPNYRPGIGGSAPVFTVGGGIWVAPRIRVGGELTVGPSWHAPQTVRVATISFAETTAAHNNLLVGSLISVNVGGVFLGGGLQLVRSRTAWKGMANYAPRPIVPFASERLTWNTAVVAAVDVPIAVGTRGAIVPSLRIHWFDHDRDRMGLSRFGIIRPTLNYELRF
jgi:hypothetical protein